MTTQIIQGQYTTKEAIDLLTQLIKVKINFHETKMEAAQSKEEKKLWKSKIVELQKKLREINKQVKQYKKGIELESLIGIMPSGTQIYEPIDLISGKFAPQDAKEVLLTLLNDKINFHKKKIFSHEERFGLVDETSKNRITELTKCRENIIRIIQDAEANNKMLTMTSTINIRLEDALS